MYSRHVLGWNLFVATAKMRTLMILKEGGVHEGLTKKEVDRAMAVNEGEAFGHLFRASEMAYDMGIEHERKRAER